LATAGVCPFFGIFWQHDNFLGKVFTHFSKPKARFVRETTYGIMASGDTMLASIVRTIDDVVAPIQTEKRLSRNMEDEASPAFKFDDIKLFASPETRQLQYVITS